MEPLRLVSISIGKAGRSEEDWGVQDTTQAQSGCDGPSDLKIYCVGAVRTIKFWRGGVPPPQQISFDLELIATAFGKRSRKGFPGSLLVFPSLVRSGLFPKIEATSDRNRSFYFQIG